jgi:hypothetical protein
MSFSRRWPRHSSARALRPISGATMGRCVRTGRGRITHHRPPGDSSLPRCAAVCRLRFTQPVYARGPARRFLAHTSHALLGAGSRCTAHTTPWYDAVWRGAASDERGFVRDRLRVRLCQCSTRAKATLQSSVPRACSSPPPPPPPLRPHYRCLHPSLAAGSQLSPGR